MAIDFSQLAPQQTIDLLKLISDQLELAHLEAVLRDHQNDEIAAIRNALHQDIVDQRKKHGLRTAPK